MIFGIVILVTVFWEKRELGRFIIERVVKVGLPLCHYNNSDMFNERLVFGAVIQ